jgi:hypothetical protein
VLRRDGVATRTFRQGKHGDSLFTARIDSAAFVNLAGEVIRRRFFSGSDEEGFHEPLSNQSVLISAATLCRRRVHSVQEPLRSGLKGPFAYMAIDSVARTLEWKKCCRHHR